MEFYKLFRDIVMRYSILLLLVILTQLSPLFISVKNFPYMFSIYGAIIPLCLVTAGSDSTVPWTPGSQDLQWHWHHKADLHSFLRWKPWSVPAFLVESVLPKNYDHCFFKKRQLPYNSLSEENKRLAWARIYKTGELYSGEVMDHWAVRMCGPDVSSP